MCDKNKSYFSVVPPCLFRQIILFFSYKDLRDKLQPFSHLVNLGGNKYLDHYVQHTISYEVNGKPSRTCSVRFLSIEFLNDYIGSSTLESLEFRVLKGKLWLNLTEIDPPIDTPQTLRTHKSFRNWCKHHHTENNQLRDLINARQYGLAILMIESGIKTENEFNPSLLGSSILHDQFLLTYSLMNHGEKCNWNDREFIISPLIRKNYQFIEFLLQKKVNFNGELFSINHLTPYEETNKFMRGSTPLVFAIENKDSQLFDLLLKYNVDVNYSTYHGNNDNHRAIYYAAKMNDIPMVKKLIDHGAIIDFSMNQIKDHDNNIISPNPMTLLAFVTKQNQTEMAKFLFSRGAKVSQSHGENHPTDLAILNQNSELFYLFSPVNLTMASLDNAALVGNLEMIRHLIKLGVLPDQQDSIGNTPLVIAVMKNHLEVCKYLLTFDIDINHKNNEKKTPLYYAIENENIEIISLLLDHGANLSIINDDFEKTLDYLWEKKPMILKQLFEKTYLSRKQTITLIEKVFFNGISTRGSHGKSCSCVDRTTLRPKTKIYGYSVGNELRCCSKDCSGPLCMYGDACILPEDADDKLLVDKIWQRKELFTSVFKDVPLDQLKFNQSNFQIYSLIFTLIENLSSLDALLKLYLETETNVCETRQVLVTAMCLSVKCALLNSARTLLKYDFPDGCLRNHLLIWSIILENCNLIDIGLENNGNIENIVVTFSKRPGNEVKLNVIDFADATQKKVAKDHLQKSNNNGITGCLIM